MPKVYRAQVVIEMSFPKATSLEEANLTLDAWIDEVALVMEDKVFWSDVEGTPAYQEVER